MGKSKLYTVVGVIWWLALFIPHFFISVFVARFLAPIVCMFVVREPYYTTVKRYGKTYQLLARDRIVWWLRWFDTDDNATDEYWYGCMMRSARGRKRIMTILCGSGTIAE